MSDLRKKLSRSKSAPKKYTIKRAAALIAFIFIFILTSISFSHDQLSSGNSTAIADGQNLVSVFYDGQNKTVATGANTVGEALKKMGITIQNGDVVEPAVNKVLDRGVTNVNIYRALTYTIVDGSKTTVTSSGYRSPRKVIEQQGVVLYPEDSVATERASNFVGDVSVGQKLIIDRATPVKVVLSGKTFEFRTHSKTVKDLLSEKGLEVKPKDIINASIDSPITDNQTIIISRLAQRISTEEIPILQTEIQNVDSTKPSDYTSVQDPGAPGKKIGARRQPRLPRRTTGRSLQRGRDQEQGRSTALFRRRQWRKTPTRAKRKSWPLLLKTDARRQCRLQGGNKPEAAEQPDMAKVGQGQTLSLGWKACIGARRQTL